ncbi:MAG: hypothetical protein LBR27_08215 [Bifidobacteriaceae bacterium]|jgi:hypothetical protein|nr:hypothetical protein [Bifidobacteriaceae bacterium]
MGRRVRLWVAVAAVLAVAGFVWAIRLVDGAHIAVCAAIGLAVVLAWRLPSLGVGQDWPEPARARGRGARTEVSYLGWSVVHADGEVSAIGLGRVRAIVAQRLGLAGVDWAAVAAGETEARRRAEAIVHPAVIAGLLNPKAPQADTLNLWLDLLEHGPPPASMLTGRAPEGAPMAAAQSMLAPSSTQTQPAEGNPA